MSNVYTDGYSFFPRDDGLLLELIIVDVDRRANYYHPTTEDVRKACSEFSLDPEAVLDMIHGMDRRVYHTLLIDVPIYRGDKKES